MHLHLQLTANVIEHNDLTLQQPEPITEEPGHNVPNAGFNHHKVDEQNVENLKDAKTVLKIMQKKIKKCK